MVGADEGLAITPLGLADPGAPVAADVHQRMDPAVLVATDDDGVLADFELYIVAGLRHLAHMCGVEPAFENDVVQFPFVNQMGSVEVRVHGIAGLFQLCGDLFRHQCLRVIDLGCYQVHCASYTVRRYHS